MNSNTSALKTNKLVPGFILTMAAAGCLIGFYRFLNYQLRINPTKNCTNYDFICSATEKTDTACETTSCITCENNNNYKFLTFAITNSFAVAICSGLSCMIYPFTPVLFGLSKLGICSDKYLPTFFKN